jgi:hypothetical protein
LADHPDAAEMSLVEIARQLGVSRERMRQLLPGWHDRRKQERVERVRRFAREHPDAARSGVSGGQGWNAIGVELGMPAIAVTRIWRKLGLPDRHLSTTEELGAHRAQQQRRRLREVLRDERCVVCQRLFAWTVQMERGRRYQGRSVTCSRMCSRQLWSARADST